MGSCRADGTCACVIGATGPDCTSQQLEGLQRLGELIVVNATDHRGALYRVAVDPEDRFVQAAFRSGSFWEAWMQPIFDKQCELAACGQQSVSIDLGANIGAHALYLARQLATQVWAIEPQHRVHEQLVRCRRPTPCHIAQRQTMGNGVFDGVSPGGEHDAL